MIREDPSADPEKRLASSKKGPHDVHAAAKLTRAKDGRVSASLGKATPDRFGA